MALCRREASTDVMGHGTSKGRRRRRRKKRRGRVFVPLDGQDRAKQGMPSTMEGIHILPGMDRGQGRGQTFKRRSQRGACLTSTLSHPRYSLILAVPAVRNSPARQKPPNPPPSLPQVREERQGGNRAWDMEHGSWGAKPSPDKWCYVCRRVGQRGVFVIYGILGNWTKREVPYHSREVHSTLREGGLDKL